VRGRGLHEKIHENCLCVEFRLAVSSTPNRNDIECCTKVELVGEYVPDLVVQQTLIVETKTIHRSPTMSVGRC
jgi:GxxExxY protein